jgi:hypothetical protein
MSNPKIFQKIADKLDLTVQVLLCRKEVLAGEKSSDGENLSDLYSSINDYTVEKDIDLSSELKAECQSAINYANTLEQSTTNKKIKSLANLVKTKVTFISENL